MRQLEGAFDYNNKMISLIYPPLQNNRMALHELKGKYMYQKLLFNIFLRKVSEHIQVMIEVDLQLLLKTSKYVFAFLTLVLYISKKRSLVNKSKKYMSFRLIADSRKLIYFYTFFNQRTLFTFLFCHILVTVQFLIIYLYVLSI